jgi:hypothetical protein
MSLTYEDFSLWIEAEEGPSAYRVTARTPSGEARERLILPQFAGFTGSDRPPGTRVAETSRHSGAAGRLDGEPRKIGGDLFAALFSGHIRQLYAASGARALAANRGLRIKLHFDLTQLAGGSLCSLPWELLYDAEARDFLGLDRRTPIVRYLEVPRATAVAPPPAAWRILLAAANPAGSPALDLRGEQRLIEQIGAENSAIAVDVVTLAGRQSLLDRLAAVPCDVLHFMGHADFDEATGAGAILLEGAQGSADPLSGEVLANLLKGRLPRLVVLNACNSARALSGPGRDFSAGLAASLVLGGVPAVVAMGAAISDPAALCFSRTLYRLLAQGEPVDAAAAEARRALYLAAPESCAWGLPVVFMRVADGRLFSATAAGEDPGTAPPDRIVIRSRDIEINDAEILNLDGAGHAVNGRGEIVVEADAFRLTGSKIINRRNSR